MGAIPNTGPVGGIGLDPLAKLLVFQAAAREYGDEAPTRAIDVIHVLARTQLGIGDIEEVCPARHGAQRVPGLNVGAGVAGIAIATAERDGDIAVGVRGQNEQELLEIGTVLLGVTVGDRRCGASADLTTPCATIGSAEADRGAV